MVRFLLGGVLVLAGVVTLVATGDGFSVLRQVLIGAVVTDDAANDDVLPAPVDF